MTVHAPTTEALHQYGTYLMQSLPKFVQQFSVLKDELSLHICPSGVVPVLTFLRDHSQCQFKSVVDITAVDYPEKDKRFEVVYNLLSFKYGGRIRVKTYAEKRMLSLVLALCSEALTGTYTSSQNTVFFLKHF